MALHLAHLVTSSLTVTSSIAVACVRLVTTLSTVLLPSSSATFVQMVLTALNSVPNKPPCKTWLAGGETATVHSGSTAASV